MEANPDAWEEERGRKRRRARERKRERKLGQVSDSALTSCGFQGRENKGERWAGEEMRPRSKHALETLLTERESERRTGEGMRPESKHTLEALLAEKESERRAGEGMTSGCKHALEALLAVTATLLQGYAAEAQLGSPRMLGGTQESTREAREWERVRADSQTVLGTGVTEHIREGDGRGDGEGEGQKPCLRGGGRRGGGEGKLCERGPLRGEVERRSGAGGGRRREVEGTCEKELVRADGKRRIGDGGEQKRDGERKIRERGHACAEMEEKRYIGGGERREGDKKIRERVHALAELERRGECAGGRDGEEAAGEVRTREGEEKRWRWYGGEVAHTGGDIHQPQTYVPAASWRDEERGGEMEGCAVSLGETVGARHKALQVCAGVRMRMFVFVCAFGFCCAVAHFDWMAWEAEGIRGPGSRHRSTSVT